jgi:hypothetical protein
MHCYNLCLSYVQTPDPTCHRESRLKPGDICLLACPARPRATCPNPASHFLFQIPIGSHHHFAPLSLVGRSEVGLGDYRELARRRSSGQAASTPPKPSKTEVAGSGTT